MSEELICEEIVPDKTAWTAAFSAAGEPLLPSVFSWRGNSYELDTVIDHWKESAPCSHGSAERYLAKHWYIIQTRDHLIMKLYFDRRTKSIQHRGNARWWLYSLLDS